MNAVRRTLIAAPSFCLLGATSLPAYSDEPAKTEPKEAAKPAANEGASGRRAPAREAHGHAATARPSPARSRAFSRSLVRSNWFPKTTDPDKIRRRRSLQQSFKYRTEKYGYVEGFGSPNPNKNPPKFYAKSTSFMGLSVMVNEKIIPALEVRRGRAEGDLRGPASTRRTVVRHPLQEHVQGRRGLESRCTASRSTSSPIATRAGCVAP